MVTGGLLWQWIGEHLPGCGGGSGSLGARSPYDLVDYKLGYLWLYGSSHEWLWLLLLLALHVRWFSFFYLYAPRVRHNFFPAINLPPPPHLFFLLFPCRINLPKFVAGSVLLPVITLCVFTTSLFSLFSLLGFYWGGFYLGSPSSSSSSSSTPPPPPPPPPPPRRLLLDDSSSSSSWTNFFSTTQATHRVGCLKEQV